MRRASFIGLIVLAAALTACAGPASVPQGSEPADSASPGTSQAAGAGSPTPTPTATADAAPPGFVVPETCDGLLSADARAAFASQGLVGGETQIYPELPIGAPLPLTDYDSYADSGEFLTDYRHCEWTAGDRRINVFVGAVDARSRELMVGDFVFFAIRPIDSTAAVLVVTADGVIPGVGVAPGNYWVLRTNSVIKVDVEPGGEPARQEAQALEEQIAANLKAD